MMPFATLSNIRVESVCKLVARSVFGVLFLLHASFSFNHRNTLPLRDGSQTLRGKSYLLNTISALPAFTSIRSPFSSLGKPRTKNQMCRQHLRNLCFSKQLSQIHSNCLMRSTRRKTGPFSTTALMQQDDNMWDDRDDIQDEEEDERRVVILRDVAMDRVIECFVDREIEIEGRKYATLMPADTPVILAQVIQACYFNF